MLKSIINYLNKRQLKYWEDVVISLTFEIEYTKGSSDSEVERLLELHKKYDAIRYGLKMLVEEKSDNENQ